MGDRRGGWIVVAEIAEQLVPLAHGAAQHGVDQTRAATAAAAALRQRDGLIDGRVIGAAAGEEELVEAEAERRPKRRVDALDRAAGEERDEVVGGPAPLHGAVGERLRLRSLATLEPEPAGGRTQGPVGPRVLLEDPPQRLERRPPRRSRSAQGSGVAAAVGGP